MTVQLKEYKMEVIRIVRSDGLPANVHFSVLYNQPMFKPDFYLRSINGKIYQFCNEDWDYCKDMSQEVKVGTSYAKKCGSTENYLVEVEEERVHATPRPCDAVEAACYQRAKKLMTTYQFIYSRQRLMINGVYCQGPLTLAQYRKIGQFRKIKFEQRVAVRKEQLQLEKFLSRWGPEAWKQAKSLGLKRERVVPYVPFKQTATSTKQQKCKIDKNTIHDSILGLYVETPSYVRSVQLANSLRLRIKSYRNNRYISFRRTYSLRDLIKKCYTQILPQMMNEGPHSESDAVSQDAKHNTVITAHGLPSVANPDNTLGTWSSYTTTELEQEFIFGTERWTPYGVNKWTVNDLGVICGLNIPYDLVKQGWDKPAFAIFKVNRYWHADVELKIQVNTNKFQVGCLQVSVLYAAAYDDNFDIDYTNVYTLSQTNHCLVDASTSNEGILVIPYKHLNPYIATDDKLGFCKVQILVLNQLECTSNTYKEASYTIYYRFKNAKFVGSLSADLVLKPQMMLLRALVKGAESALRQVDKDLNRDKPPEVSPPVSFTPRNTSTWCGGRNIPEPTHSLRLDMMGQTPHPMLTMSSSKIADVVNVYGLLYKGLPWSTDKNSGDMLFSMDAAPMMTFDTYNELKYGDNMRVFCLPPVSVISNLFGYWRGTLDVRIDIVGTPYHKGQLLVSYVPIDKIISLEQAYSSNYTICDLSETRTFTINVPFIYHKHMYPRKYNKNLTKQVTVSPPGRLTCFVLNPLVPMDAVPKNIYINVYIRGGSDFEVMVPVQPSIGLGNNVHVNIAQRNKFNSDNYVDRVGWLPFYDFGSTANNQNTNYSFLILCDVNNDLYKSQGIVTHSTNLSNLSPVWSKNIAFSKHRYFSLPHSVRVEYEKDKFVYIRYVFPYLVKKDPPTYGMIGLTKDNAIRGIGKDFISDYNLLWDVFVADSLPEFYDNSLPFNADNQGMLGGFIFQQFPRLELDVLRYQMDEREKDSNVITRMTGFLNSTNFGETTIGEYFGDLKDLCRRYQLYHKIIGNINNKDLGKVYCIIPIRPKGIYGELSSNSNTIQEKNRCREGAIPIIASGYRFFRGSLRFRIMSRSRLDTNIIIQHRPETRSCCHVSYPDSQIFDYDTFLNHGYAQVIQNLNLNNVVDIEIPYYNPNVLCCTSENVSNIDETCWDLGSLYIGFDNYASTLSVNLSVYYCIGDDFRFDTFQGFPPMGDISSIPDAEFITHSILSTPSPSEFSEDDYDVIVRPQMGLKKDLGCWFRMPRNIEELNSKATITPEDIDEVKSSVKLGIKQGIGNITSLLMNLFNNIIHCVITPTIEHVAWSVANMLAQLSILNAKAVIKFKELFCKLFVYKSSDTKIVVKNKDDGTQIKEALMARFGPSSSNPFHPDNKTSKQTDSSNIWCDNNIVPQMDDGDEHAAGICSLIFGGVCAMVGCAVEKVSMKTFVPILLKSLSTGAQGANNIFRFVKNNFKVIRKMYEYVMCHKYSPFRRMRVLENEHADIKQWATAVDILLQPRFRTFVETKPMWRDAVFGCARYGFLYLSDNDKQRKTTSADGLIRNLYDNIVKLRNELQNTKIFPSLRQEAFSLWIFGAPGIGKSTLVDNLTTSMLKSVEFTHTSELKHCIHPTTKHWDGCNQQPVVCIDDAFCIDEVETNLMQLWAYFQICSPIPLRPPMAAIEDKKMTYNPEIFVTCSNESFPKIIQLRHPEALYRRRHLLVRAELIKEATSENYPFGLNPNDIKEFKHLNFFIAKDVRNPKTLYHGPFTYEQLTNMCSEKFYNFKKHSKETYDERHKLHYSLYPSEVDIPEEATIRDIYAAISTKAVEDSKEIVDSHGYKLKDSLQLLKKMKETIAEYFKGKQTPKEEIPVVLRDEETDKIIAEIEELERPMSLDEALSISVPVMSQMDDCDKIHNYTEFISNVRNPVKNIDYDFLKEINVHPEDEIVYKASSSKLCKDFEAEMVKPLQKLSSYLRENSVCYYTMFEKLPQIANLCIKGNVDPQFLKVNCVHKFIQKHNHLVSDNENNLFILVNYRDAIFAVYDTPCNGKDCIVTTKQWSRLLNSWYASNYSRYNKMLHEHKYNNFSILKHFGYRSKVLVKARDTLHHIVNKYKEFGIWNGIIMPSFSALGGIIRKFYNAFVDILPIVSLLACGWITVRSFKHAFALGKQEKEPQLISSGDIGTHNRANNTRLIVSKTLTKPQLSDSNLGAVIQKRLNNNTVYISFRNKLTGKTAEMRCLVLKGRECLVIKHYYDYLVTNYNNNTECYLQWNDCGMLPFDYRKFSWRWFDKDSNFGVITLPLQFSARKSLIHFIASEHQCNTSVSTEIDLVEVTPDSSNIYTQAVSFQKMVYIQPTSYSEELEMSGCWRYKRNYPGMCGSIVLSCNLPQPIIGMHVAGGQGFGYAEPLTREMFREFEQQSVDGPIVEYRELDIVEVPVEERKIYLNGSHRYLGNIDVNETFRLAKTEIGISRIVPSGIHGVFPVLTEPGPLTPKDPRIERKFSPLVSGCEKMCEPTFDFNGKDLVESEEHLFKKLISVAKPLRLNVEPLSEFESLNGIENLEGYEHINWDTSEGFPLSRLRPKTARNKRWLFEFNEQGKAIKIRPELRDIMDHKMCDRKNGIVPVTLHDDCLKDARILKEKVTVPGKTRIFSISPVDFTIQFRQYYLDFIAAYCKARFDAEHAIGINVHGMEWTDLTHLVASNYMITGDYSGFGPTLNTEVLSAAFRIIFKWYQHFECSDQSHKIRYIMSREIMNARHLMNDYVYQTCCGMPSGNPATVVMNSLVNSLYLRCAYLKIMRPTLYRGLYSFSKYIVLITYGDDLIAKLDPCIVEDFNFNSLSYFFLSQNIKFTDAAKTGTTVAPYINIKEATFLKHSFLKHPTRPNVFLAGLDKVSVTECANWVRIAPDLKEATRQNCEQATMLAYGWGPTYYNEIFVVINKAWRDKYDEPFECRTWEELDQLFLDENWNPELKW